MPKFKFFVEERYSAIYEVEANNPEEAYEKIDNLVFNGVASPVKEGSNGGDYEYNIMSADDLVGKAIKVN